MTPRDQIQEHAKIAAAKIREAMAEFLEATGLEAQVYFQYVRYIGDDAPILRSVHVVWGASARAAAES